ncbi:hypothetical protein MRX96_034248 [Rhipicephalus microplus]
MDVTSRKQDDGTEQLSAWSTPSQRQAPPGLLTIQGASFLPKQGTVSVRTRRQKTRSREQNASAVRKTEAAENNGDNVPAKRDVIRFWTPDERHNHRATLNHHVSRKKRIYVWTESPVGNRWGAAKS